MATRRWARTSPDPHFVPKATTPRIRGVVVSGSLEKGGRGEIAAQYASGIDVPPPLQQGRVVAAEIDRERKVAVAIEAIEGGRRTVEAALHRAAHDEVSAGSTVVGAAALVLARSAPELGVVGDHGRAPPVGFDQRLAQRREPVSQLAQEVGMRAQLVRVRVEASERKAHDRNARLVRRKLRGGVGPVAEWPRGKLGGEIWSRPPP